MNKTLSSPIVGDAPACNLNEIEKIKSASIPRDRMAERKMSNAARSNLPYSLLEGIEIKSMKTPQKTTTIRRAFTMKLKPGAMKEYRRLHQNIWKELVDEIERSGIAHFTTFEADPVLFLYSEIYDAKAWDKLWSSEIHAKWAKLFEPLMQFTPEGIVDAGELREVFHIETKTNRDVGGKKK